MNITLIGTLNMGIFFALLSGLVGLLIAVVWSPFLLTEHFRQLFGSLSRFDWHINYVLWIPLPAVGWGFLWGSVVSLSLNIRPPTAASAIYVAGLDGIVVATAVSLVCWPVLLLYVLPARGFDWYANKATSTTISLVIGGTVWYLPWLVIPAYVLGLVFGWGDVLAGP